MSGFAFTSKMLSRKHLALGALLTTLLCVQSSLQQGEMKSEKNAWLCSSLSLIRELTEQTANNTQATCKLSCLFNLFAPSAAYIKDMVMRAALLAPSRVMLYKRGAVIQ